MTIETVDDFKTFMEANREKMWSRARKAKDIPYDDEWMQDNVWDELYKEDVKANEQT